MWRGGEGADGKGRGGGGEGARGAPGGGHLELLGPRQILLHVDREELVPNLTAKELEVRVEATLNELFARAPCDQGEVTYDELYAALILVEPRVAHIGRRAIEEALAQMELADKVLYREAIVHLI